MKIHLKQRVRIVIVLIVGMAIGLLGWRRFASAIDKTDPEVVKANSASDLVVLTDHQLKLVSTTTVKNDFITLDRKATGKVGFNEDRLTPVFTPYSGRIAELLVNKGDEVKPGQPLAVLESPDYVSAQNDLAAARSDVVKARIGLKAAEVASERARILHDQEAIATKDMQQAEADLARAQDEVHRSEVVLASVENRVSMFGKDADEIANLGERVDRRVVVRAPIKGMIVDRKIGPGQYVKPDSPEPLFLISDLSALWILVDVYESDLGAIRLNMPVQVTIAAYPDRTFPARISFISPTLDPATRTVRVRCLVPNSEGLLKPEMFATVKIDSIGQQRVPVIPAEAVIADGDDSIVFLAETGNRFRMHRIQLGHQLDAGGFIVDKGLQGGELVAVRGSILLNEMRKSGGK